MQPIDTALDRKTATEKYSYLNGDYAPLKHLIFMQQTVPGSSTRMPNSCHPTFDLGLSGWRGWVRVLWFCINAPLSERRK